MKQLFTVFALASLFASTADAGPQGSDDAAIYGKPKCERGYRYDKETKTCVLIPRGSH